MKNSIILLVSAGLFLMTACSQDEVKEKQERLRELQKEKASIAAEIRTLETELDGLGAGSINKRVELVNTEPLKKQLFEHYVDVFANVEATNNINVSPEISGVAEKVMVKEGDQVKEGQVLAVVDTDLIRKNIREVENQLELAETVFQKQNRLWKQNIGTEMQYLEAKNNKESLERKLESLQAQLDKAYIKAPVSGNIDEVFIKQGESVAPGMPVARVVNLDEIKLTAEVSERYLGKIKEGDIVQVEFPDQHKETDAKVLAVGQNINSLNRTFKVTIGLKEEDLTLRPNQVAVVKFRDFVKKDAIVVPADIVLYEDSNYVFVAEKKNNEIEAKKKSVITGPSYKGKTLIVEGLDETDNIITAGSRKVTNGQIIKVANEEPKITNGK